MIPIKKTKSVQMFGSEKEVVVDIKGVVGEWHEIRIPIRLVFQIKRGLESYTQKFYRKHK